MSVEGEKKMKVLVIGAGATGTCLVGLLKKAFGEKVTLELWDKGKGIGGRMSTFRMTRNSTLSCDLGAQYFTITKEYLQKHENIYDELLRNKILRPLTTEVIGMKASDAQDTQHFMAPNGSASIPKHFLLQSGCTVRTSTFLHTVSSTHTGVKAEAVASQTGMDSTTDLACAADVLVITMPIPQVLNLKGYISEMMNPFLYKLKDVKYSSRYVLGLFFPDLSKLENIDWSAKYFLDNPCIRYVSMDTVKRNKDPSSGLSVVIHTSVPFTKANLNKSFEEVESLVVENLKVVLPSLPPICEKQFMRWRYSQVSKSYNGAHGYLVLNSHPLVLLAGDAFVHSNLSGCIESASSSVEYIKNYMSNER